MDRHELAGATAEEIAAAHTADVAIQEQFGVHYVTYWFDYQRQHAFCLAEGPDRVAVDEVHRRAHGKLATQIIDVDEATVARFMGGLSAHAMGEAYEDPGFRAILFTDLVGSTELTQRLGDVAAMEVLRRHDAIVRGAIADSGGSEVKHTGDGIMASFKSAATAIEAATAIQRGFEAAQSEGDFDASVRIGIAAGEPVAEGADLFGTVVQLAARLTAHAKPGAILVSRDVRDLASDRAFVFGEEKPARLKGFSEAVPVVEVRLSAQ
jgi:class 3 adenylate cyclase